ncbi:MAG TPA: glycosyl hydrolase family 18 protein [Nakamurella sp.]
MRRRAIDLRSARMAGSVSRRSALALLGVLAGAAVGAAVGCRPETFAAPEPRPPLPDRVVAMWMYDWRDPSIGDLPPDVLDTVNVLVVAIAQARTPGTGRLRWSPYRDEPDRMRAQIAAMVERGKPVLLGVGGSNDGGITVTDDIQVTEFCDSVRGFVADYGFTGIDLDLEPSGSRWTQPALAEVVRRLKVEHGPDFLIGLTVALYDDHTERWLTLAGELGEDCDFFAHMLYDYVEATDERLDHDARRKVRIAVDGGVPASRQVLGFMCNAPTHSSPVALTGRVWASALVEFPDLRGAFIWESSIEHSADYPWTRTIGVTVSRS